MKLGRLVDPQSIAIFGATERPSPGRTLLLALDRLGFKGDVYPINPKYERVLGRTCYPSLRDLPTAPDVVALCVGAADMLAHFTTLAEIGAGGAVVYGGGFAERGEDGKKLQSAIHAICTEAGIALCGPNCMGVLNPPSCSTTYIYEVRDPRRLVGNVGLISQSGSIGNGMLADVRRFGYSLVVSSGNEAVVNTAALIEHMVDDPATHVIATFTETIREPERYVAALDRAADAGKPVVVLKVGRSERAQRAITSHTGGLAGESRVFSELLRAHRAIEVRDMDELTEVLAACQGPRLPTGNRIAVITGSGGQAELILDVASEAGVNLPPLPAAERAEVERVIGPITGDGNPLDAWGNGDWNTNMPHAMSVLNDSKANDVIVYCADAHEDQPMISPERLIDDVALFANSAAKSQKPHYLLNTRPGVMNDLQVRFLAERGIIHLGGTRQGLGAIDRLARYVAPRARPAQPVAKRQDCLAKLVVAEPGRRTINEADSKKILSSYGMAISREQLVTTLAEAKAAARDVGFPVVVKAIADELPHKSDYGLVEVKLANEEQVEKAWVNLAGRLARITQPFNLRGFLVQEFVPQGIEVFAGIARDPNFGLSIALGMGGVDIEILRDFSLRMLPLHEGDAEAMLAELRGAALLGDHRGRKAADTKALVDCLYRLSEFAEAEGDMLAEVDLNPIKVLPEGEGVVIVDALIVTR